MQIRSLQMKRALRSVLLILLLSAVGMGKMNASYDFSAVCETGQTLYYNIIDADNHYVELTYPSSLYYLGWSGYAQPTGNIILPDSVQYNGDNYIVTSIGSNAFYNCSGLTSVTLPNFLTTIGYGAFQDCSGITGNLTIPDSVTELGGSAFENCSGFTGNLTIGNSVTTIGNGAFYGCEGFTGSLTIPNSVTSIGGNAFSGCSGFTGNLTIPNSITTIGNGAFNNCIGFTGSLVIPNSVTYLSGFSGCTGFDGELIIPKSVTEMGRNAFFGCSGFMEVYYDIIDCADINSYNDNSPFLGCGGSLIIGDDVVRIPDRMFCNCSGFTGELTIGNSVTTIGNSAFYGCSNFTGDLMIPNSVTTIGESAFYDCSGFSGSLTIGNSVTTIGTKAFQGCSGFTGSLTIGDSLSSIVGLICSDFEQINVSSGNVYYDSRNNCNAIINSSTNELVLGCKNTVIPNSVTSIGEEAFFGCSGLTSLELPNSVTSIGFRAFNYCDNLNAVYYEGSIDQWCNISFSDNPLYYAHNLYIDNELVTNLVIPETVTEIKALTFYNATCLTSLTIHNSVTSIGASAFSGCNGLTGDLTIPNSVTTIGWSAFSGCSSFTGSLTIPNSVTFIDGYAFSGCSSFTGSLTLGESVTTIGRFAFYGCSGFTGSLTLGESVTTIDRYAFCNCSGFTGNLTIPNSVTSIGEYAFFGCEGFTGSLTVPNSVISIGGSAFSGCSGLTGSLTLSNSVTEIGNLAFNGCSGFSGNLIIPNSLTSIGNFAFFNCSGFSGELIIGNSVTTIGTNAFCLCRNLTEIMMLGTIPPSLGSDAFYGTTCPIYVPYESLNAYKTATNWSDYESRIFPMAYTTISGYGEGEGNYCFIASPLVENTDPTTVDNMITETAYDLYRFDQSENAEWQNYKYPENTPNFFLANGQGYLYANAEDVNVIFKGEFNEDDTKEEGLAYDANAEFAGWNLVGNPFPVNAYANKSYYTMNEEGTAVEPNMVSSATAIPACTGVMVMAEAEDETVVFSTEAPEAATNQGCLRIAVAQANKRGTSTGSVTALDKAIVSFNAGDRLEKFVFNKENAVISIPQGGKELAIACSDKQGEIPLNFKATKNGEYTITIYPEAVKLDYLHLIDNLTGADVDLLAASPSTGSGAGYTFEAKTSDYASRFRLVFSSSEMDGPSTGSGTFAFINNGNIIINGEGTLQIVDVTGRILICKDALNASLTTEEMVPGVYVLRLINGNNVKTQKIVIE